MKVVYLDRLMTYHDDEEYDRDDQNQEAGDVTKTSNETTIQNLEED